MINKVYDYSLDIWIRERYLKKPVKNPAFFHQMPSRRQTVEKTGVYFTKCLRRGKRLKYPAIF